MESAFKKKTKWHLSDLNGAISRSEKGQKEKKGALVKKGTPLRFEYGQLSEVKGAIIKGEKGHLSDLNRGPYQRQMRHLSEVVRGTCKQCSTGTFST